MASNVVPITVAHGDGIDGEIAAASRHNVKPSEDLFHSVFDEVRALLLRKANKARA